MINYRGQRIQDQPRNRQIVTPPPSYLCMRNQCTAVLGEIFTKFRLSLIHLFQQFRINIPWSAIGYICTEYRILYNKHVHCTLCKVYWQNTKEMNSKFSRWQFCNKIRFLSRTGRLLNRRARASMYCTQTDYIRQNWTVHQMNHDLPGRLI